MPDNLCHRACCPTLARAVTYALTLTVVRSPRSLMRKAQHAVGIRLCCNHCILVFVTVEVRCQRTSYSFDRRISSWQAHRRSLAVTARVSCFGLHERTRPLHQQPDDDNSHNAQNPCPLAGPPHGKKAKGHWSGISSGFWAPLVGRARGRPGLGRRLRVSPVPITEHLEEHGCQLRVVLFHELSVAYAGVDICDTHDTTSYKRVSLGCSKGLP